MATIYQSVESHAKSLGKVLSIRLSSDFAITKALVQTSTSGLALVFASPMDKLTTISHLSSRRAKKEGFTLKSN